jgi:hypothetical protein
MNEGRFIDGLWRLNTPTNRPFIKRLFYCLKFDRPCRVVWSHRASQGKSEWLLSGALMTALLKTAYSLGYGAFGVAARMPNIC